MPTTSTGGIRFAFPPPDPVIPRPERVAMSLPIRVYSDFV
jgi:hypothetical protein